jgi:hypothetical protein
MRIAGRMVLLAALVGLAATLAVGCSSGTETRTTATTAPQTTTSQTATPETTISTEATTSTTAAPSAGATDYSDASHWMVVPSSADKPVDVFYLYPTSYQKQSDSSPNICAVDDPIMVKYSQLAFARQATAFTTVGNIYAPFYRQADAGYTLTLPQDEQDKVVGGIPTTDATAAFAYYIEHYNNGRPFILAGHSQGSNVLLYLLSGYLKDRPDVYARMVAAYVVGYSVTPDYLAANPHLKFATGPDDTGVIISYNTQAPEIGGKNPVVLPGALAINPITWTTDETAAAASQNLGSIALNSDGSPVLGEDGTPAPVKDFADATVDKAQGVIICSTAPVDKLAPGNAVFPKGVYHSFDYPFYYFDIRANAAERVDKYLAAQ